MNVVAGYRKNTIFFFIIIVVLFLIYGNSLHSPWILDDVGNIVDNKPIHLQQLDATSIINTFYANPDLPGRLYRPIACFSFALNWFVGQDDPFGYHIVNICIHALTAFFLYLTCSHLVSLSFFSFPSTFKVHAYPVAAMAALLWAMNPMQTQSVTYIVQRMAALAALFTIIGIFFFLKARTGIFLYEKILFSFFCFFSFLLALGSKQNAVLFPFSILLLEYIFFKSKVDPQLETQKRKILYLFILLGCLTIFIFTSRINWIDYNERTFTLQQRILTSPRILLFYLSQLFFPAASRLSIEHDIVFSNSLFEPWTTLPAIAGCLLLIAAGFAVRRKDQFLSFALLFYFLNHTIESTILPLEPIFEHRNYLPSLFLFLPVSVRAVLLLERNFIRWPVASGVIIIIIIILGVNTYTRNEAWVSGATLWNDAYRKAPNSSRAAINLAREYALAGKINESLSLAKHSYNLWQPTKKYAEALSLNGQGVIASLQGDKLKEIDSFQESLKLVPYYREARANLIVALCKQYRFQEALMQFSKNYFDPHLEGIILLWMNKPIEALVKFRHAVPILEAQNMASIGKALSIIGKHEQADFYLRQAGYFSELNKLIQLENLLRANKTEQAQILCQEMFSQYQAEGVFNTLFQENTLKVPLDRNLVIPFVVNQAKYLLIR